MSDAAPAAAPPEPGWQPLTFGGVAEFAVAPPRRLLLVQLIVAALVSGSLIWFAYSRYCPVITQAIAKMPQSAVISDGKLRGLSDNIETGTKFLVLAATPEPTHEIGQGADLQIQLRQTDFCAVSVFRPDWGMVFPYRKNVQVSLGPTGAGAWWGAWEPMLLATTGLGTIVFLFVAWAILATLYLFPAKWLAGAAGRELATSGAWKMCSAALMPGALVMVMAIFLYGCQAVDLTGLAFFEIAHLIIGWVYVAGAALAVRRAGIQPKKENPFATPSER